MITTRQRTLILVPLLGLAAAAWALLIWQAARDMMAMGGLTQGMDAALFLVMWVAMMVAIMFPTAAPMILTFATVQAGKRQRGNGFVPTWIFVASYLLLWSGLGVVAFAAAQAIDALTAQSMWLADNGSRLGGLVLIAAGVYQLTPLKRVCLNKCRTPIAFIMTSWREGTGGAFRMGLEHGWYCAGCCWLLFVILFPLGVMNILAMAIIAAVIFAEKTLPVGPRIAQAAAVVLVVYGAVAVVMPGVLPIMGPGSPVGSPGMDGM
ncbi:MAG: DUF2182 domain-containing protein [Chloroflexota bacterium]